MARLAILLSLLSASVFVDARAGHRGLAHVQRRHPSNGLAHLANRGEGLVADLPNAVQRAVEATATPDTKGAAAVNGLAGAVDDGGNPVGGADTTATDPGAVAPVPSDTAADTTPTTPADTAAAATTGGILPTDPLASLSDALAPSGTTPATTPSTTAPTTTAAATTPTTTAATTTPATVAPAHKTTNTPAEVETETTSAFPGSTTSAAADTEDSDSDSTASGIAKKTVIALGVVGGLVGGGFLLWTVIRKTRFSPSKRFNDKLNPVDFGDEVQFPAQAAGAAGTGAAAGGLHRTDSLGSSVSRNEKSEWGRSDWGHGSEAGFAPRPSPQMAQHPMGMAPPTVPYAGLQRSDSARSNGSARQLVGLEGIVPPRVGTPVSGAFPPPPRIGTPVSGAFPQRVGTPVQGSFPHYPAPPMTPVTGGYPYPGLPPQQQPMMNPYDAYNGGRQPQGGADYDPYYRGGY